MADLYELRFVWPHPEPSDVVVTGTFDNWTSSVHLQRTQSGFEGTVKVPWSSKILYKFRVDGYWITHEKQPTEVDPAGNWNNVAYTPDKTPASNVDETDEKTVIVVEKDDTIPAPPPVEDSPEPAPSDPVQEPKREEITPPDEEKNEVAPIAVPVPIQPVLGGSTEPFKEPGDIPGSTHTAAPAPAPEPIEPSIETPALAPEPKPEPIPTPAPAPVESTPEPSPAPAPIAESPTESHPDPTKPEDKPAEIVRPVTPPPKTGNAPSNPSTPIPAPVNGHTPSTPAKGPTPFPTTGDSPGRDSISSRSGRKKRVSIIDKLKNIFHHKDTSPERSEKASEKKRHRHSLFHSQSSSTTDN